MGLRIPESFGLSAMASTYSIYCFRFAKPAAFVSAGHSLASAKAICRDPATSWRTSEDPELWKRWGGKFGSEQWFYGYREEL